MASHYSNTNGSLIHATASRPIIPTNRRRQPTIERGFSGVKVPIISLEQELDKSHLNDLVSIVAKESTKLQTKPDPNRPDSIKRRSLQKPNVSTKPELALAVENGVDNKQVSNLASSAVSNNQQPKVHGGRRGFPLFSPVSRQTGKSGGNKPKGFFAQEEPTASNAALRKDGIRLFRFRFGKNKLTSARPKSFNQLSLEIEANAVLKDVDSNAIVLNSDDERNPVAAAAPVASSLSPRTSPVGREAKEQNEENQDAWAKMVEATQQPLTSASDESHSTSKHADSERMTKSRSAKELAERARVAAAELRKSVNAANATTFSSFSRKTEVQGGSAIDHQEDASRSEQYNSTEELQEASNHNTSELVQGTNIEIVPPVSPLAPSTVEKNVQVEAENESTRVEGTKQMIQSVQEKGGAAVEQQNNEKDRGETGEAIVKGQVDIKTENSTTFQLLSSSWTPIKRNSVHGANEEDIPISAHRMSVLEKQVTVAPSESGRRLSNFAGMLTEVPNRVSSGVQLNPGLEISMIQSSSNNEDESPNKSRLAAFLNQANATAPVELPISMEDDSPSKNITKAKPTEIAPSTASSAGLVKSVVSRLSVKATLPPSVIRIQTPPSKTSPSNHESVTGDISVGKSIATSPVIVSPPVPPRTAEEIKAMVERNVARMAAFLESVRLAQEAAAKAAEAARAPPPEPEKPKKAFLKAYLAVTASHNAKVRGEPDPATLEPQQPLSRLAAFLAEITPPQPPAAKSKRGKPFFRSATTSSSQTPSFSSTAQPKAPQQPSRLSMFLSSSSSSSKSATPIETISKVQTKENAIDSFPSDVEIHGDRLRTQYVHRGSKTTKLANEDVSEKKEVGTVVAQKEKDTSDSSGTRRNSKLVAQSSMFRRPSLPRAVSSPSIRDAQPSSNSPKTRSRKNSSASPSPKPTSDKKSPVIAKSIELEDKRVAELSDGRSEAVKSVSLKDFSLKDTLEKYQRSASGKGKKLLLGEDGSDHDGESQERRRPSIVNSVSLKNVSLAETLAMYQANSSRSLTNKSTSSN